MADINELAQQLADHIKQIASEYWPGATLLTVIDGAAQWTDGYVWCDLAGSTVRCFVPSSLNLTGGSQIIYGIPVGSGPSSDYICIGLAWNGLDNTRVPRIRAAEVTNDSGAPGSGTVTSVALSAAPASVFGVAGSPIINNGTLALTLDNQAANIVLAGPTTGAAAEPAFRVLVAADIPIASLDHNSMTNLAVGDAHTQYVLLAPTTDTRNVIQPSAATVKALVLKGAAAQSDNLQEWQNSSGTALAYINNLGSLGIGRDPGTTMVIAAQRTFTNTSGDIFGMLFQPILIPSADGTASVYGIAVYPNIGSTGYDASLLRGIFIQPSIEHTAGASLSSVTSIAILPNFTATSAGAITSLYGIIINNPNVIAGSTESVTTQYGLVINDLTTGSTNYAILTNAGHIVFNEGGNANSDFRHESDTQTHNLFSQASTNRVGINDSAPGHQLDVGGDINTTGVFMVDDVQVVSNRVIDARIDDVPNSGDATTDGIIAAIQSILTTHGLAAAA